MTRQGRALATTFMLASSWGKQSHGRGEGSWRVQMSSKVSARMRGGALLQVSGGSKLKGRPSRQ